MVVGVCGDGVVSLAVWSGGGSAGLGVREAGEKKLKKQIHFCGKIRTKPILG